MDKTSEIKILRDAAKKLGPNSYCGPWLEEQIPFAESAIRGDVYPDVSALSMAAAERMVREMMENAKAEAGSIIERARTEAEKIIGSAQEFATNTKAAAKSALSRIIQSI